jgi:hypothetical protein
MNGERAEVKGNRMHGGKLLESRRLENHEEANPATTNNQHPTSNIQ